jgi:hypothetical protein
MYGSRISEKVENDILYLEMLKRSLFDLLVPLELIESFIGLDDEDDNKIIDDFIIWFDDKMVEKIGLTDSVIQYKKLLDEVREKNYTLDISNVCNLQLRLEL